MSETNYLSLYRKYSPKNFNELVGQELVKKYFINSILNNTLSHAYIFEGPSGVGKTSTCKILAYTMNCLNLNDKNEPCYQCESCLAIKNKIGDLKSIDGATNRGIDTIKALQEDLVWPPRFKRRIIVIDEAHMLTEAAWNSLLATIEEPPENIIFIFATTDCKKIPKTIATRCQTFHFHPIDNDTMLKKLKYICNYENIQYDNLDTIKKVIEYSNGSLRMAQGILEQSLNISNQSKNIDLQDVNNILFSNNENLSTEIYNLIMKANEADLCLFFNNINYNVTEDVFYDIIVRIRYEILDKKINHDVYKVLVECMEIFIEYKNKLNYNSYAKTILEVCCLKCIVLVKQFLNNNNNLDGSFLTYLNTNQENKDMESFILVNKIKLFLDIISSMNSSLYNLISQSQLELIDNGKILSIYLEDNNPNNIKLIRDSLKSLRGQKIKSIIEIDNFSVNKILC